MKCYGDFLRALNAWTARTGWPIWNATDAYKAAEAAGFTRAEIIKFYGIHRQRIDEGRP